MCDIRLLTNNPAKENGLTHNGIRVIERIPIVISSCETNSFYLKTKKEKMGHYI